MLSYPTWKYCANVMLKSTSSISRPAERPLYLSSIFGMYQFQQLLKGKIIASWFHSENTKRFRRPKPASAGNIPNPAARVADSLSLCQILLAPSELFFRPLTVTNVSDDRLVIAAAQR